VTRILRTREERWRHAVFATGIDEDEETVEDNG
jgi:hypothetical protein